MLSHSTPRRLKPILSLRDISSSLLPKISRQYWRQLPEILIPPIDRSLYVYERTIPAKTQRPKVLPRSTMKPKHPQNFYCPKWYIISRVHRSEKRLAVPHNHREHQPDESVSYLDSSFATAW
ncbi:hypothetical protein D3C71_848160 [compost metagenome]